jgi:Holliday junction resolvase-like predicted endonuclease
MPFVLKTYWIFIIYILVDNKKKFRNTQEYFLMEQRPPNSYFLLFDVIAVFLEVQTYCNKIMDLSKDT